MTPVKIFSIEETTQTDPQEIAKSKLISCTIIQKINQKLKENIILILTILSVGLGIGLGFILRAYTNFKPPTKKYFGVPGELFLRALKFLILPLISSSLITGIAGLGIQKTRKVAVRAFIFYFFSTFSAVLVGLLVVTTIKPGMLNKDAIQMSVDNIDERKITPADTFIDLLK